MDSTIALSYPWWYIGLCLLLGAVYAFALYFKDTTFKDAGRFVQNAIKWLSLVRFLAVSFLAFLLLMPLLKNRVTEVENPIIIYAQDNSESMRSALNGDTTTFQNTTQNIIKKLEEKYAVHSYQFADNFKDELNYTYNEKTTNIEKALGELYDRYTNQNVGAVILSTDGIYNEGGNPVYSNRKLNVPVYSIAVGDTTPKRDIKIERIYHNKIAYLRDKFTVRVDVYATNCEGEGTNLKAIKINKNGDENRVALEKVIVKTGDFTKTYEFELEANTPGINKYSIQLDKIKGEETWRNNIQNIYVEVLDSRQKILLLADAPHPDLSTLKTIIETNENYETKTGFIRTFKDDISLYDLVILHGLPSKANPSEKALKTIKEKSIPVLYIVSQQTDIERFNKAQSLLLVRGSKNQMNDAKAEAVDNFTLFTIEPGILENLSNLPPVNTPFGEYAIGENTVTLLRQKIGSVNTNYPLLILEQSNVVKSAAFAGEGIWRWRMYDYQGDNQLETIEELFGKTIQYLSVKSDKRKFRTNSSKNLYYENERITFDAELYNDSYQLVNDSDVSLSIFDEAGKEFPFIFNKTANAYKLDAGIFPVGVYTFKSKTTYAGNSYDAEGEFNVIPRELEALNTTANHQLLYTLAERTGGQVFYQNDLEALTDSLLNQQNIKPVMFSNFKNRAFINLKWLFFMLLGFLAFEWFIRKYNGGY